MQRRRVHAITSSIGTTGPLNLQADVDETNGANLHGLRCSMAIEPENAGANANGLWVLWCLPDAQSPIPNANFGSMETEAGNAFVWALGTWIASNETPWQHDIEIRTSRNCQNGARIVLTIEIAGVSAGNVRYNRILTYFTKSL